MAVKNEGICRFCEKTFAGRGIGRHLQACKVKKERDLQDAEGKKRQQRIYHLRIQGYSPYWMHIEMPAAARLRDLDAFLREIWVECCGHLSEFTIGDGSYGDFESMWGTSRVLSLNQRLDKVLQPGDSFEYQYDFGSTTHLQGRVYAEREGVLPEKVRILARNTTPVYPCSACGQPATVFCYECDEVYCDACLAEQGYDIEMTLPLVNSPRAGVCGYEGDLDWDDWQPSGQAG